MGAFVPGPEERVVLLRDMVLQARIGVYAHEHGRAQRLRINLELLVEAPAGGPASDELREVVDYAQVARVVRRTVEAGHVRLVETLAERIAQDVSRSDDRIRMIVVRLEKLDAMPDVAAVGVEISRSRSNLSTTAD